jgi:MarR family transcriptional regulator, negative regulator of the multidrug operon emrRAB
MHDRTSNLLGAAGLVVVDLMKAAVAEAGGGNPSASAALVTLSREPGISTTALARAVKLTQPAVSRLVDGLVSRGLIERHHGSGRAVALRLTAGGQAAVRQLLDARRDVLDTLVAPLDEAERVALERSLEKVLDRAYDGVGSTWVLCRLCDDVACTARGAVCPVGHARRQRGAQREQGEQP